MKEITNRSWRSLWGVACFALALAVLLAVWLAVLSARLMKVQAQAAGLITQLSVLMGEMKEGTFETSVRVDQEIAVQGEYPVDFTLDVPIQTTLPVDTTVRVPVKIPLAGIVELSVPIQAEVPVDIRVAVPIRQTVPIDIRVPVQMDVPVRIRIADTPLAESLAELQAQLAQMAGELGVAAP